MQRADTRTFDQVFSGLGIGLVLGLIVGLSASPVVQTILGALASLLAVLLGLHDGAGADAERPGAGVRARMNALRIGSFGFGCAAAILLGLFLRTHDLLSVPVERQVEQWTRAGYTLRDAQHFVALQRLGVPPGGAQPTIGPLQMSQATALMESPVDAGVCNAIRMEQFGGDAGEVVAAYRRQPLAGLHALADEVDKLPGERKGDILRAFEEVLCRAETSGSDD